MGWLNAVTEDIQRALVLAIVLLFLTLLLVAVLVVAFLWREWYNLSPPVKFLLVAGAVIVGLMIALVTGALVEDQVYAVWEASVAYAYHLWMRFDGFTRSHSWVGMVLLGLMPLLLWLLRGEDTDNA